MTVDCWYGLAGIASCACNVQNFLYFFLLFKDEADLRMESFSCKQSLQRLFITWSLYQDEIKPSFKLEYKRTSTTLSDHIGKLKENNRLQHQMGGRRKGEAIDKVCKLCLQEKLSILRSAPSLNK